MKKAACVLFVLIICMNSWVAALAEYEFTNIEGNLVSIFDYTPSKWMESSMYRALLTVSLAVDVGLQEDIPYQANYYEGSYVGRSENDLVVMVGTEDKNVVLSIMYNPYLNHVRYLFTENNASFDAFCKYVLTDWCENGYYKNDISDILEVTDLLIEALNE